MANQNREEISRVVRTPEPERNARESFKGSSHSEPVKVEPATLTVEQINDLPDK